jgi:lipoyl-dependent peroxiredoxin
MTKPTKIVYTARASAIGGREGHAKSDDGLLDVKLLIPKEMGGPGGGVNPD